VTAHHLEDQAETFLLRLARGSGVDGLGAIDPTACLYGIRLIRPLLNVPRARLKASLEAINHPWITDPSNENEQFSRIKIRKFQNVLNELGMTPERLTATARRMRDAREVLENAADRLARDAVQLNAAGYCTIRHENLAAAPRDTALRLLARCLVAIGGNPDRPRYSKTEALLASIIEHDKSRRTFWGCRIVRRRDRIWIWREAGRAGLPTVSIRRGECAIWDGRFSIKFNVYGKHPKPPELKVRALGDNGMRQVSEMMPDIPADLKRTFISFWRENELVAVPHLGWNQNGFDCEAVFTGRIIRHADAKM
ncbi:MAG: hypothetical protein K8F25_09540, partial [Fimbriimonadaceae bacterium]|nr:hypothetical protein [Alphaproteobacteria bacterium]